MKINATLCSNMHYAIKTTLENDFTKQKGLTTIKCLLSNSVRLQFQSKMLTPSMLLIVSLMIILHLNFEQCFGQNTMSYNTENGRYSCSTCIVGGRRGRSLCRGCVSGVSDAQFSCRRCSPGSVPSSYDCRGFTNNNPEFGEKSQNT